jgi:hypothetical protein
MHVLSCIIMDEIGMSSCHFLMYLQFVLILDWAAGDLSDLTRTCGFERHPLAALQAACTENHSQKQ